MSTRKPHPRDRYFRFLARLNRGGRSNMYGAIPYLAAAFGLDRESAFRVICEWVDAQAAAQASAAGQPPKLAAAPEPSAAAASVPTDSARSRRAPARSAVPRTRAPLPETRRRIANQNPPPLAPQRTATNASSKPAPLNRQPATVSRKPTAVSRKPVGVKRKRPGARRAA